jgi:integrase
MQGSIQKRIGKRGTTWTVVLDLPRDPVTGRRRQTRVSAGTRKELEALQAKTLHEIQAGSYVEPTTLTVGQFLDQWLAALTVRGASLERYDRAVRGRIVAALGAIPLAKLTPQRIQAFYRELADAGLCSTTAAFHHTVLRKALGQAVAWRLVPVNVAAAVPRPRPRHIEMATWSAEQARQFLMNTLDDPLSALWQLALSTGLRRGELLALRWPDVDLARGTISIQRTQTRTKRGLEEGEVKTRAGKRRLSLSASTTEALRAHRHAQVAQRLALGGAWTDENRVFERGDGRRLRPDVLHRRFKKRIARAGVPDIRLHDLRHTAATLMLANGENPKIVAERLGHSSIAITMDLYSHVTEDMQRAAAERLDSLLRVTKR